MTILNPLFKRRCLQVAAFALMMFAFPLAAENVSAHDRPALLSHRARAPLLVFTNGCGHVGPFHNGQMLFVGQEYRIVAIPQAGYVFTGWSRVNAFTIVEYLTDGPITTSTVLSPLPESRRNRILEFTVQPPDVLFDLPNVRTITMSQGWQANFVRETR